MKALSFTVLHVCCWWWLSSVKLISQCTSGDIFLQQQDFAAASTEYKNCLAKDPNNADLILHYAEVLFLSGMYHLAKIEYHGLETDSIHRVIAVGRLAQIYDTQKNLAKAIKYYSALTQIYPGNPNHLRKLGFLYQQANEFVQAVESYRIVLKSHSSDLLTIEAYAELAHKLNDISLSDSLCNIGLTMDSMHVGLTLLFAKNKFRLRDYQAVVKSLTNLQVDTDLNNYYHKLLGYALIQTGAIDSAILHLQRSLLNENDPEYALYYLGLAYEKKRDYSVSSYYYQEALKAAISVNIVQYHKGLARNAVNLKDQASAIRYYTEALRYSDDPEILFYLANLSENFYKDKKKAIRWYEKYLGSKTQNKENKEIARQRLRQLKERNFMNNGLKSNQD